MVDRDVVIAKSVTVDRCLRRIGEAREPGRNLERQDVQDIVELNLQRAVQATIDLAAHVVSTEGYGTPVRLADTFVILAGEGLIDEALGGRLAKMVGFRNLVIHEYGTVDPEIVERIVETRLVDLRSFVDRVLERFGVAGL